MDKEQEEPKHISAKPFLDNADEVIVIHRPKQETLEEAAENNYPKGDVWTEEQAIIRRLAFMNGAKSDAARDYWFEQFKKK